MAKQKRMTHDYHIRLDDKTWEYLQALRKDDPKFSIAYWIRNQIRQLYSQRIFYKSKYKQLNYEKIKENSKNGKEKKRPGKTADKKKAR